MLPERNANASTVAVSIIAALLVVIGVVGRWGQPEWAVTPLAATALLAGYLLPLRLAMAVPLVAMLISDLLLPAYSSVMVAVAVYGTMAVAPLMGALMRKPVDSRSAGLARLVGLSASPAVVFFLTTNFAVWAGQSMYPKTALGLIECYTAAIPFFRGMLVGDMAYTGLLFGIAAAAGLYSLRGAAGQLTATDRRAA